MRPQTASHHDPRDLGGRAKLHTPGPPWQMGGTPPFRRPASLAVAPPVRVQPQRSRSICSERIASRNRVAEHRLAQSRPPAAPRAGPNTHACCASQPPTRARRSRTDPHGPPPARRRGSRTFIEAGTAAEHRTATDSAPARPRRPSPARAARRRACRRAFRPPHGGRAARRAARRRASPADALTAPSAGRPPRRPASLLSSARRRPAGRARRGGAVRHALSRRAATVQWHKSQHELLCVPVSVW